MKISEPKTAANNLAVKKEQPFFQKEGSEHGEVGRDRAAFFQPVSEALPFSASHRFFNPVLIQRKCEGCEEEKVRTKLEYPYRNLPANPAISSMQLPHVPTYQTIIQRKQGKTTLEQIREKLDQVNTPEGEVIVLLSKLTTDEKKTVINESWYKEKMLSAFDFGEMMRAVINLDPPLKIQLQWLKEEANAISAIDYHEIKSLITNASDTEKAAINDSWKDFFISVCTNANIIEAVDDLNLPLKKQLEWVDEEIASARASINYSEIQPLIQSAPQTERDALKSDRCRGFFTDVCDNTTIILAVKDLNFDPLTRIEWIMDEGNVGSLIGGGIDSKMFFLAINDAFSGEALQFISLASLNAWRKGEMQLIRKIMDSVRNDRPAFKDTLEDPAKLLSSPANQLIEANTSISYSKEAGEEKRLDTGGLARALSGKLNSEQALVRQVLDILSAGEESHLSNLDDDVIVKTLKLVNDEKLEEIVKNANSRALLLTMVKKLFKGATTGRDEEQQARLMQVISDFDAKDREAKGETTKVEVITFLYGGQTFDTIGETLGRMRGHTAIVVGDLLYSFEAGWSCGYSKAEYLSKNTYRDGIGQILNVTTDDAKILQKNLNNSCGTGLYFVSRDICTGKTSKQLDKALKMKLYEVENPQIFVSYLEATGLVVGRKFYPKTSAP